jgi:NAD-dependent deacetylase
MDAVQTFIDYVNQSNKIVFFGGAGVSTQSGIPDFRSVDGLYHQKYDEPPETILSATYFEARTEDFYRFYREKMLYLDAQPNVTHRVLAELEQMGKLTGVVTQNIDGLHQKAGSKKVYELHGSVLRNYCRRCRTFYSAEFIKNSTGIPRCKCGGVIKPDVVLYEEGLDDDVVNGAVRAIAGADLLIVGGTSLVVYPAAGLLRYFRGKHLVLINLDSTPYDSSADLVIHDSLGKVFGALEEALKA